MQRIFKTTGKITDAMVDCIVRESNEDWSARGKTAQDIDECFREEVERACANFQQGEISVAHIVETEFSFIDYVVCTISPAYQKSNPRTLRNLVNCYKNCMKLAELKHTLQIAFPVLGMGEGGYPMGEAVCAAITAAKEWIEENEDSSLEIYFCAENWEVMEQFDIYYPFCDWDSEKQYDDAVMKIMDTLLESPLLPTRQKAIEALETMLEQAKEQRNSAVIQLYRRLLFDMGQTSDATYNLLRENAKDGIMRKNERKEDQAIESVRYIFSLGKTTFTAENLASHFKMPVIIAKMILSKLLRMRYIAFAQFIGQTVLYKIVIPEQDFYLCHGA